MRRLWQQLAIATNWPVLVAVAVLVTMGAISIRADDPADGSKQIVFVCIGVTCMAAVQGINYQVLGRFAWAFYIGGLLLVLYTVLPGVPRGGFGGVPIINGAHCWINLGVGSHQFSLEPAELVKIGFVMVLARYLRYRSSYRSFAGLLAPFALCLVPVLFILRQPDLGTALIFIPGLFAMLFVAGAKLRHLLAIVVAAVAFVPFAWLSGQDLPVFRHLPALVRPYQRQRVLAMFNSDPATLRKAGYQIEQGLTAMGSGGLAGKGFGQIPFGRHVPEAHNDMVFAIIGEQFGFFGSVAILGAYVVLLTAGVEISAATREPFGKLVAVGIVSLLAAQAFINLCVVMRIMPVTGITLPFVSYGGSSLLASFIAAGLLLNIGQNRPMVLARAAFEFD